MKNLFLSLLAGLLVFAGQQTARAQNDSKPANEAAELVKAATDSKADLEGFAKNGIAVPELTKENNDQLNRLLLQQIDLVGRIVEAGAAMSKSKLAAFKTEIADLDQQFGALIAKPKTTQNFMSACRESCYKNYPNWTQTAARWGCIWICFWNGHW